jgi:hypothetical protein
MLARWAEEVSNAYDLEDAQRARVREAVAKRWGRFLTEHRSTIQPIVAELLEMRLELKPPTKERVQNWAERAAPLFDKIRKQFDETTTEFRKVLTPVQRVRFEVDLLQFRAGMMFTQQKLARWRKGDYQEDDFWEPPSGDRHQRRLERRRRRLEEASKAAAVTGGSPAGASPAPAAAPTDQVIVELKVWDGYVDKFMARYRLNEGQRDAVLSVLSEMKKRAIAHRDHKLREIASLERRINTFGGSDDELADLKTQLTKLYGPIDEMFKELQRRIDQVPTAAQRAAAAQSAE